MTKPDLPRKVAIVHYRAGRTDGVSLEVDKRKTVLERLGFAVRIVYGPLQRGADFVIEELEFDSPNIRSIKENAFRFFRNTSMSGEELMRQIDDVSRAIEHAFLTYHARERFDALLLHNVLSHGRHIAAASAFTRVIDASGLRVLATHHDHYWERPEYQEPRCDDVARYITTYVPPGLPNVQHVCINSIAARGFEERSGLRCDVLGDVFDFDQPEWKPDAFNRTLLDDIDVRAEDLLVLQATRIVERKGIELAIAFVAALSDRLNEIQGKRIYNGKRVTNETRVVLVLAGYTEKSAIPYEQKLRRVATDANIEVLFIGETIGATRTHGAQKSYSLWDVYAHADMVTYPSQQEGWGNQFLEAVFSKKPIAVFEYPVFASDIKPEGYAYISLGDNVNRQRGSIALPPAKLESAVTGALHWLCSPDTPEALERNAHLGRQHHGFEALERFLASSVLNQVL
jgi:glycosyltransferase involved in cell wall biosynthesis